MIAPSECRQLAGVRKPSFGLAPADARRRLLQPFPLSRFMPNKVLAPISPTAAIFGVLVPQTVSKYG
jgi:hypothetical protein